MTEQQKIELRAKISDAESKYHQLMLGLMPRVIVDQNGERVEFVASNRSALYTYIQQLKSQLPGEYAMSVSKPLGFFF